MLDADSASLSKVSLSPSEWFAFRVRPRHEKLVALQLAQKQIHCLLPISRQNRYWAKRLTVVELPVFPGFVFAFVQTADLQRVLETRGVIDVVRTGTTPCVVPLHEISAVERVIRASVPLERVPYLPAGERSTVLDGPLTGIAGWVVRNTESDKLLLPLSVLRCSVQVELDHCAFAAVNQQYGAAQIESYVADVL